MQTHGCEPCEAQQIMRQLVGAVAHMHASGVCHRDLRLANVMLRAGPHCCVKLIDLGAAGPADKLLSRRTPIVPVYAAPELLPPPSGQPQPEYSGRAVDVWALGVILHVLLTGTYPFTSEDATRQCKLEPHEMITADLAALLSGMLCHDRAARLSAADVLKHAWLVEEAPPPSPTVATGSPAAWLRAAKAKAAAEEGVPAAEADEAVLNELHKLGMDRKVVLAALEAGARDEFTTAYCLLWQKNTRHAQKCLFPDEMAEGEDMPSSPGGELEQPPTADNDIVIDPAAEGAAADVADDGA